MFRGETEFYRHLVLRKERMCPIPKDMRPANLTTKIFLDSGDPNETKALIGLLGFLDGQTTNPTLVARNPEAGARLQQGKKFSREEITAFYKKIVSEISALIPKGSVSIEVYADRNTSAEDMLLQGKEMFSWIPNAHIKYPITKAGLDAAERSVEKSMRVNMTLCFSQEQAAAVYAATRGAKRGGVFVSPFAGRLDDQGEDGMSLIERIIAMYRDGDGHVEVLAASIRNMSHLLRAFQLKSDIVTAPFKVLKEWAEAGMPAPGDDFRHDSGGRASLSYTRVDLNNSPESFDIHHELTDQGLDRFARDWNELIG